MFTFLCLNLHEIHLMFFCKHFFKMYILYEIPCAHIDSHNSVRIIELLCHSHILFFFCIHFYSTNVCIYSFNVIYLLYLFACGVILISSLYSFIEWSLRGFRLQYYHHHHIHGIVCANIHVHSFMFAFMFAYSIYIV